MLTDITDDEIVNKAIILTVTMPSSFTSNSFVNLSRHFHRRRLSSSKSELCLARQKSHNHRHSCPMLKLLGPWNTFLRSPHNASRNIGTLFFQLPKHMHHQETLQHPPFVYEYLFLCNYCEGSS